MSKVCGAYGACPFSPVQDTAGCPCNEAEKEKRALWERICRRGLSWKGFRELTGKSEKEVQQINLRLWVRGHTDQMNRMISQGRRRR